MLTCKLLFAAASGIRRWHDEKQATYSAHLFEEETLTGKEALQTLDHFVDCEFWLREAGSKLASFPGPIRKMGPGNEARSLMALEIGLDT